MLLLAFIEALRKAVIRAERKQSPAQEQAGARPATGRQPTTRAARHPMRKRWQQFRRGAPVVLSSFVLVSFALFLQRETRIALLVPTAAADVHTQGPTPLRMRTSFLPTH